MGSKEEEQEKTPPIPLKGDIEKPLNVNDNVDENENANVNEDANENGNGNENGNVSVGGIKPLSIPSISPSLSLNPSSSLIENNNEEQKSDVPPTLSIEEADKKTNIKEGGTTTAASPAKDEGISISQYYVEEMVKKIKQLIEYDEQHLDYDERYRRLHNEATQLCMESMHFPYEKAKKYINFIKRNPDASEEEFNIFMRKLNEEKW